MAAGDVARSIRAPGRLVINPTDLTDDFPYGGTEVGKVRGVVLMSLGQPFHVFSEGVGEITDVLEADNHYVFSCLVRGWDDDAIRLFFSDNYVAGATSQHSVFVAPGSSHAGASALNRSVMALYVPDDIIHVPSVIIYRGIPDWTEGSEMAFQRGEELALPVTLLCLRTSSNNILAIGRLADLTPY